MTGDEAATHDTSIPAALIDELTSINSIFEPDTLSVVSTGSPTNAIAVLLRLPTVRSITIRLHFPLSYPELPPYVTGLESVVGSGGEHGIAKGTGRQVADIVSRVLQQTWTSGEPCIYSMLDELGPELETKHLANSGQNESEGNSTDHAAGANTAVGGGGEEDQEQTRKKITDRDPGGGGGGATFEGENVATTTLELPSSWTLSDIVTEKKSVFVARVAPVRSVAEARALIDQLLATDKKMARATHNISAWRVRCVPEASTASSAGRPMVTCQDFDDDGETAAGSRLLHLLQLMDVWDVVVVVSRWYGGIHLGPDRFRIINNVARDAVEKGGFTVNRREKPGHKK